VFIRYNSQHQPYNDEGDSCFWEIVDDVNDEEDCHGDEAADRRVTSPADIRSRGPSSCVSVSCDHSADERYESQHLLTRQTCIQTSNPSLHQGRSQDFGSEREGE